MKSDITNDSSLVKNYATKIILGDYDNMQTVRSFSKNL